MPSPWCHPVECQISGLPARRQPFEPPGTVTSSISLYRESHRGASMAKIQLEWEPRIIPSIEEGVGWGSKVMTTDLLSVVTVRRKCKQLLQSIAHLLQRLWHKSFHQPSFNLTPFWDVCLSARKYLITFEYKGSSLATKEIILKYCIQRSFPLLILFFLLNPMNVSWDRWY